MRKSTSNIKYPKFPKPEVVFRYRDYSKWRLKMIKIIEEQIEKDSEVMGGDLAYYFDIRPLLEVLRNE